MQSPKPTDRPPAPGPQLRLWSPSSTPATTGLGLSPRLTLSQFYTAYVVPCVLRPEAARPRTAAQYAETLRYWEQFTAGPTLDEMHQGHAADFLAALASLPGNRRGSTISPNTIRKHCTHAQRCLDLAGPPSTRHRMAADLIDRPPFLIRPRQRHKLAEDAFTLDEVRAWLAAAQNAETPHLPATPAPLWWAALIRWTWATGLRIGTTLAARWDWLDPSALTLQIPDSDYKGGQARRFHTSPPALEAVQPLRATGRGPLVFPWPYTRWYLDRVRVRMLAEAGLPPTRRFGFHGLRKGAATALAEKNPLAAQLAMGHASAKTTRDHYVHPDLVARALDELPQP